MVRSEYGRNDARQGEEGGALEAQGRAGRRPATSRCEPRSSRRPSRREYGVEVERQTAVCAQGNATQQRKGTQPNKGRERNPTKQGNETQQQSEGTKPKNKARERNPRTKQGNETRRQKGHRPEERKGHRPKDRRPRRPARARRRRRRGGGRHHQGPLWRSGAMFGHPGSTAVEREGDTDPAQNERECERRRTSVNAG